MAAAPAYRFVFKAEKVAQSIKYSLAESGTGMTVHTCEPSAQGLRWQQPDRQRGGGEEKERGERGENTEGGWGDGNRMREEERGREEKGREERGREEKGKRWKAGIYF